MFIIPHRQLLLGSCHFLTSLPCFHKRPQNSSENLSGCKPVGSAFLSCALQNGTRSSSACHRCEGDILVGGFLAFMSRHPLRRVPVDVSVCEGCSALLGQAGPCHAGAAGTEQLALTGLHIRPTGFTSARGIPGISRQFWRLNLVQQQ